MKSKVSAPDGVSREIYKISGKLHYWTSAQLLFVWSGEEKWSHRNLKHWDITKIYSIKGREVNIASKQGHLISSYSLPSFDTGPSRGATNIHRYMSPLGKSHTCYWGEVFWICCRSQNTFALFIGSAFLRMGTEMGQLGRSWIGPN